MGRLVFETNGEPALLVAGVHQLEEQVGAALAMVPVGDAEGIPPTPKQPP